MDKPFPLDENAFLAAARTELAVFLDAMLRHWGFAPEVSLHARRMVVFKVRPEGRDASCSVIVRPGSRQTERPATTAARILRSVEWMKRWRPDGGGRQHMSQASLLPWETHLAFAVSVREAVNAALASRPDLPRLVVWAEPILNVMADFNLKGFAHKSQGVFVTLDNHGSSRSPAKVAKLVAAELVDHRQTCDRCGEGLPPLQSRASGMYWKNTDAIDTPPDPVERMVRPVTSRRLDRRLAQAGEAR